MPLSPEPLQSTSAVTLEQLSPSSITSSTLMNVANTSLATMPPSGAAVPRSPPHAYQRVSPGSLSERRGYTYTIAFQATKPIGQVAVAKGDLEPRAGSLPRRTRKKVPAPPKVVEDKRFELIHTTMHVSG
ncbi:hypothetical protein VNI00_016812 [Paramarasmius palmivorus]|uniref:Uncharacterized protein n=1 Tax=Paramarasmius palmivorus TaxID=297713 RepID=A0AAW0BCT9_9AGAR